MVVVFDSNVWISSLRFGGVADRVLRAGITNYPIAISQFITGEVLRVLGTKFGYLDEDLQAIRWEMEKASTLVHPTGPVPTVCRDPDDNQVLHLCQHVAAELLVTGDNDLRVLGQFGPTQILSPAEVAQRWGL